MTVGKKPARIPPLILEVNKDMWFKVKIDVVLGYRVCLQI